MAWDPVSVIGGTEPLYFGPLAGYDTEELDRRGLDQDKKTTKGFKWVSPTAGETEATTNAKTKISATATLQEQPLDPRPPLQDLDENHRSKKFGSDELPTWDEFTQKTTFHGLRYIFDKTRFKIRRILWLCIVTLAVLLFVGQVGSRVAVYFQYKSNVAVKVNYVDQIQFPSVTICNQNNYRTSATVGWNLYGFIDNVFSSANASELDLRQYNLNVDTEDFILSTAHQKHNLIDRCTWENHPCDIDKDFKVTVTDLGVCYTFNGKSPSLSVTEPGSTTGLGLILNVEQYEYMRGPQNDAGVKIHLHDQGEVPQMKDQGFAVAPGTHTLVAVKRFEIASLSEPYGKCEVMNPVPVSECQLNCKTEKVLEVCGCHDLYMSQTEAVNGNSTICDMERKFICVPSQLGEFPLYFDCYAGKCDNFVRSIENSSCHTSSTTDHAHSTREANLSQETGDCNCLVPCRRVGYEPYLSYAQLSKINVERLIIDTKEKEQMIETSFHNARETSQRVVKEIIHKDNTTISVLLDSMQRLLDLLNSYYDVMQDFNKMAEKLEAPDILTGDIIIKDELKLEEIIKTVSTVSSVSINPNFDYLWRWQVQYVEEGMVFQNGGNSSLTLQYLTFCSDAKLDRGYLSSGGYVPSNDDIDSDADAANSGGDTGISGGDNKGGSSGSYNSTGSGADTNSTVAPSEASQNTTLLSIMYPDTETSGYVIGSGSGNGTGSGSGSSSYTTSSAGPPIHDGDALTPPINKGDLPDVAESVTAQGTNMTEDSTDIPALDNPQNVEIKEDPVDLRDYPWATINDVSQCSPTFAELVDLMNSIYDDIDNDLRIVRRKLIQDQFAKYRQAVADAFQNTTANLSSIAPHVGCLDLEEELTVMDDLFILITELGANITHAQSFDQAYGYAIQIPPLYKLRKQYDETQFNDIESNAATKCGWLRNYGRETNEAGTKALHGLEKVTDEKESALRQFGSLTKLFNKLHHEVLHKIQPTVQLGYDYVSGKITKVELAEAFVAAHFTKAIQDLADCNADLVDIAKDFTNAILKGRDRLVFVYDELFDLKLPVLNAFTVNLLGLVKQAKVLNDSRIENIVDRLQFDIEENLIELIRETYNRLMNPTAAFTEPVKDLIGKIENFVEDLKEYKASTKMNTEFFMENFMQVDIFYQELSYEEIEQNIAFEFLSLLSEIGGFLGLLLGASVLTVCELVDYISLSFLNKLQAQKKVFPIQQNE